MTPWLCKDCGFQFYFHFDNNYVDIQETFCYSLISFIDIRGRVDRRTCMGLGDHKFNNHINTRRCILILPLISGDVLTDVSVWADNFTILLQFYNPINTILIIIFISGDVLTDVSVWAGQTMYSAHRLVLALSSSYFRSHFIISYFLSPILLPKYVFSLIDLMGKV